MVICNADQLSLLLTHDFIKEGWLMKKGPNASDAFRKRWVTLDRRKLMYTEDPMVCVNFSYLLYNKVATTVTTVECECVCV